MYHMEVMPGFVLVLFFNHSIECDFFSLHTRLSGAVSIDL